MRTCPICHGPFDEAQKSPDHPFCSARCKLLDLGNWLGSEYRILDGAPPAPSTGPGSQADDR